MTVTHPWANLLAGVDCVTCCCSISITLTVCHLLLVTREGGEGGWWWGGLAQGLGIRLLAFGGAYWPLATAHSDPLWARTCFGCVNGAPGLLVLFDYSGVGCPGDGLLPVPLTRCIRMVGGGDAMVIPDTPVGSTGSIFK